MCAYPIEVFNFGAPNFKAHEVLIRLLNSAQSEYYYFIPSEETSSWAAPLVREQYELENVYGKLERFRDTHGGFHPFMIAILHGTLSDGTSPSINMEFMKGRGIAVLTTKKWQQQTIQPPMAFLSYVFAHSATIFTYPGKFMHPEELNCLFDENISDALRRDMHLINICDHCMDEIEKVVDPHTMTAIIRMVDSIKVMPFDSPPPKTYRPKVFIGCSSEGKRVAKLLQLGLTESVDCMIWDQGVFGLSFGNLDSLVAATSQFDYAILVMTPDDQTETRGRTLNTVRDNVLFELGLFMGKLGRDRTFMVSPDDVQLDLPSDLAGVTRATYRQGDGASLGAVLGAVCTRLEQAMHVG
jgi:hypothetical protein